MASYMSAFTDLEIQLEVIKSATNNFHASRVIGSGGFGNVYKGELPRSKGKIEVAFKRLDRKRGQGDPEFFKEIRTLSSYKHDNLISLLGYCNEGNERILMYEYASRGSLKQILNDVTLTWTQRLKICLGAAEGLSFLHDPNGTQQRVLHCDIKSANILLDENLNAKVADFGLSKIGPANQQHTFLVTCPVGTPGYCDPLYMDAYQLTKESDVFSFGVVLFEVLCGRVCYEYINGELKVFVHSWKKCYEQKKLDEIIFPNIRHQLDPSSVETFVAIAYQCLQKTREQRPTMSVVVEKLKAALELNEQGEILKLADPPLIFKCVKELKALLSKGFRVIGGKTLLSINDKGEVCERIYIEACLDPIQYDRLKDPSDLENSRFPGGRSYFKYEEELKIHVRAEFLCPLITYSLNLVFRNAERKRCKTLDYKLDAETKCCMVYDTYEREDGWIVAPLYQFTSDHKTADFEISFEGFRTGCKLQVAGFEFQPLEENMELHDQGLEEYQDIVKATSQYLLYKSPEELKELLSIGFYIDNRNTWFSMNEYGEHCEMLSIAHCLISREGGYNFCHTDLYSRFPGYYKTNQEGFKVHIRTQFLTPSISYTVGLVLRRKDEYSEEKKYVGLRYRLEGETETSIVYLATTTNDNRYFVAELYQFTSNGRTFDLDIVFEDHKYELQVEGILFQPLENLLSVNDKGEIICQRIGIKACLDPIQYDRLEVFSDFENSRFPGARCYCKHEEILKVRVRAQFLCPLITYSVNLVFRNTDRMTYIMTVHYKLNGEAKCCMVYNTYKREDGWFLVPLYQFTSNHKTANFEIEFEGFRNGCKLQVAGFEFQPLEEKVELHDQGLEEYQDMVKVASQSLFYKSLEELKELLSIGFHIDNHKTWFSLNEIGEHCEMLSIAHCLISREGGYSFCCTDLYSRFPRYYRTNQEGFKVHIRTQFLTPSIRYTVNLVIRKDDFYKKKKFVALRYKLKGETETSIVYLATTTKDNHSFIAELYQFTSDGRVFDLEIVFLDHKDTLEVEGILFQPLEKVEHEQVLDDENLPYYNLQWTTTKVEKMDTNLLKWFKKEYKLLDYCEEGYAVDNNGKKSLILSTSAIRSGSYKSSPESRFRKVTVITDNCFDIVKKIEPAVLSSETTYACYLVYKFTGDQLVLETPHTKDRNFIRGYIYLQSPPKTPIIGQKLDQKTHTPFKRSELIAVPRQRSDGWMEVKVWKFQTPSSADTIDMYIMLVTSDYRCISGLIIESIELRPIVAHSA